jgi:hypothetical protein
LTQIPLGQTCGKLIGHFITSQSADFLLQLKFGHFTNPIEHPLISLHSSTVFLQELSGHFTGVASSQVLGFIHSSLFCTQLPSQHKTGFSKGHSEFHEQSLGFLLQVLSIHLNGASHEQVTKVPQFKSFEQVPLGQSKKPLGQF